MNWLISLGISLVALFIGNMLFSFFRDLKKDKYDLKEQTLGEKFKVIVDMLNLDAFNGKGIVIPIDKKSFNLYEEGQNQIIYFAYSTGHLTITWGYKYFQKEVVHEKTFRFVRNLSLFEQQKIAVEMINEMSIVVENHKKNVLTPQGMEERVDFHKGGPKDNQEEHTVIKTDSEKAIEKTKLALGYYASGKAKINRQDYIGAIADYTKAIDIDPEYAESYYQRGLANADLHDCRSAIADFTKVIEIEPEDQFAYCFRGLAKFYLQDYIGALADYNKAIELMPDFAMAYNHRGIAKYNLQDHKGAISDYTEAIELEPNNAQAYYLRGIAKIELGQKESGCLDLSKAGELGIAYAYEAIKKYCQ